jgi:hypothetical protein
VTPDRAGQVRAPCRDRLAGSQRTRRRHLHPHRALQVRATDLHAELVEDGQHVRVRVAVPVVTADADECDLRLGGRQERRIAGGAAVVWHRQQVDGQVDAALEQVRLRVTFHVAGEQRAATRVAHVQHGGALVAFAARVPVRASRRRAEHLDDEVTEHHPIAPGHITDGDVPLRRLGQHLRRFRQLGRQRPVPHGPDVQPSEHLRDATHVVEVAVGDDQQVERGPTVFPQPARCGGVLAGVDEHPRARRLDQVGVALPDVDRRDGEPGRWQAPTDLRHAGHRDQHDAGHERHVGSPRPRSQQEPHAPGHQRRQRDRPPEVRPSPQTGEPVGGGQHEVGRRAGEDEHQRAEGRYGQGQRATDERDRGGDRRGRDGDEVRRDRREGDLTEGREQDGDDRDLGTDGDRRQVRHPGRQSLWQMGAHPRRRDEDPRRRRGRQHQPERAGEPRVDEHQQQHGDGQTVPGVPRDPADRGGQQHQRHRPRALHARLEPGDEREPGHDEGDGQPPSPCPDPQQSEHPEHPTEHDRHVAAGHRGQVRQPGGLHRVLVRRRQQPRVAGDEPDEQAPNAFVEVAGGGLPDPRTNVLARPSERSRVPRRLPARHVQHHPHVLPSEPGAVAAVRQRARARLCPPARAERWRIVLQRQRCPLPRGRPGHLLHPQDDVPARRDRTRFVDDRAEDLRLPALSRQARQQPEIGGGDPQRGAHRRDRHDREDGEHAPPDRPLRRARGGPGRLRPSAVPGPPEHDDGRARRDAERRHQPGAAESRTDRMAERRAGPLPQPPTRERCQGPQRRRAEDRPDRGTTRPTPAVRAGLRALVLAGSVVGA